jgi:hypothetical protein
MLSLPPQNANFKDLTPMTIRSPEDKLRIAEDLRWAAWRLKAAWLREIHPDWSDLRIEEEVRGIFLHA